MRSNPRWTTRIRAHSALPSSQATRRPDSLDRAPSLLPVFAWTVVPAERMPASACACATEIGLSDDLLTAVRNVARRCATLLRSPSWSLYIRARCCTHAGFDVLPADVSPALPYRHDACTNVPPAARSSTTSRATQMRPLEYCPRARSVAVGIRVLRNGMALAASLAACGSGSKPVEVSGTVAGQTITPREAISMAGNPACSNWSGLNSTILTVVITDGASTCTAALHDDVS